MQAIHEIPFVHSKPVEKKLKADKMEKPDDLFLIRCAKKGDPDAFEALFVRYQTQVMSLAFRITGDKESAKDVTQETFIRLFRSLNQFKNDKKFFSWLYRITVNICYDHLRREKRFFHSPLDEENLKIDQNFSPVEKGKSELAEKIFELTGLLSTAQKTAFILRESEGLKCGEIAKILDCPVATVRSYLHFARAKLKELIQTNYPELLEGTGYEL